MTGGRPVVLVIEDEPQIRRFLHTALDAQSFEVIEAETGARGITDAANRRPECIILDLGLPDMSAAEMAAILECSLARLRDVANEQGTADDESESTRATA